MSEQEEITYLQGQINDLRQKISQKQIPQRAKHAFRTNQPVGLPKIPVWIVLGGGAGVLVSYALNLPSDQALWVIIGFAIAGFIAGEIIIPKIF